MAFFEKWNPGFSNLVVKSLCHRNFLEKQSLPTKYFSKKVSNFLQKSFQPLIFFAPMSMVPARVPPSLRHRRVKQVNIYIYIYINNDMVIKYNFKVYFWRFFRWFCTRWRHQLPVFVCRQYLQNIHTYPYLPSVEIRLFAQLSPSPNTPGKKGFFPTSVSAVSFLFICCLTFSSKIANFH